MLKKSHDSFTWFSIKSPNHAFNAMVNEKFSLNPKVIGKRVFQKAILYLTAIKYKYL